MIITRQFTFAMLVLVLISPLICAQSSRSIPSLSQGVRLVVNPLDELSRALGLRDEELARAARDGVESNRWRFSESSDLVISVSIHSLPQRDEDLYAFRVEVHGGTSQELTVGKEFSNDIIGDIPAVKTIDIPRDDYSKMLETVKQLASKVAAKLRTEVIRRQKRR